MEEILKIYQKEVGKIIVRIISDDKIGHEKEKKILNFFKTNCPDEMEVEVIKVDYIPLSANNKRHVVVSEIKNI